MDPRIWIRIHIKMWGRSVLDPDPNRIQIMGRGSVDLDPDLEFGSRQPKKGPKKVKSEVKPSLVGWRLPLEPASPFFQRRNKCCFLIKFFSSSNFFIKIPEYRTRCSRRTYLVDCRILSRMSIAIILWNI